MAGPLVRAACARHLRDLRDGPARGLRWDPEAARRSCSFFPDVLRLAEGEFDGQPFILRAWQQFIVGSLFGWKNAADGYRRFRNAYIEIGKGNGKSPLAAGIGIYMLCADGEASAECYSAAVTKDQAGILFRDAVRMVEASPALRKRIVGSGGLKVTNLAHVDSGSFFRPVSAEHRGLDGKRVHYSAIDELHEHPSPLVVDKMRAGTKGRRQALVFRITNSGFDRSTVCFHEHEYSRKVVDGLVVDDSWFAYVCALDEKDEWSDESCWTKANPNLGVSIPRKYLREQVTEALGMPSKQNIVKRLNFCIWTQQENAAIRPEDWNACKGSKRDADPREILDRLLRKLSGRACFMALDLSSSRDITADVKVFPSELENGRFIAIPRFWLPEENVRARMAENRVPYDVWIREGFLRTTPGDIVDYHAIEKEILADCERFEVREICFDPYFATSIANDLQSLGIPNDRLVKFPQTFAFFAEPTKQFLDVLLPSRRIVHLGNPPLAWMAGNLYVIEDSNGNRRPVKKKDFGKIDGIVALIMALGRALASPQGGSSVYDSRGVILL